ncbi:E3 binding domain-containing protein, partial [Clostridium perfringens]
LAQAETAEQYEAENPGLGEAVADAPAAVPTPPTVCAEPVEARADSATLAARPSTSSGRTGEEHKDAVVLASPAVRARARDLGVELSQIR